MLRPNFLHKVTINAFYDILIVNRHLCRNCFYPRFPFRTITDIQVLKHCEIPPIRTVFVEELGEGAFGRVHKAIHQDGLEFFKCQHDFSRNRRKQFVAVKELHGGYAYLCTRTCA